MKILLTGDTHYGFTFKTDRILRKRLAQWDKDIDVLVHTGDWMSHKQ
jgi:predicted phosphodiesterase